MAIRIISIINGLKIKGYIFLRTETDYNSYNVQGKIFSKEHLSKGLMFSKRLLKADMPAPVAI